LRRIFAILFIVLLVDYGLNRLTANWHYVLPVESGKVAYLATFDALQQDWNLSVGRLKSEILDTGVLRLEVGDIKSLPFAEANPYFGDFDLQVEATPVDGPENNGYGVIFRLQNKDNSSPDDDDFYLFLISSDGYYRVVRSFNHEQKELSTWIPSPAVIQHTGVTNRLRVVAKGDQFQFFINGQQVALCIPDDPTARSTYSEQTGECTGGKMLDTLADSSIPNGQIGVAAETFDEAGVVVDFDNLVVYGPSP
jgi:hypothetical protein